MIIPHKVKHASLREEIDQLISSGDTTRAYTLLAQLWKATSSPALASFVVSRFERLRPSLDNLNLLFCKIAILRSFTVEPVIPILADDPAPKCIV